MCYELRFVVLKPGQVSSFFQYKIKEQARPEYWSVVLATGEAEAKDYKSEVCLVYVVSSTPVIATQ